MIRLKFLSLLLLPLLVASATRGSHGHARALKGKKCKSPKSPKSPKHLRQLKKGKKSSKSSFKRVSTFLVCSQLDPDCNTDTETVAEIVVATDDGMHLVYSNSEYGSVGLIDISDPSNPIAAGEIDVGGEPTSVTVRGELILVSINTSDDYVNTSGTLKAIDIATKTVLATTWELGGQPDAITVSPDKSKIMIAIENERDEDLEELDGAPPQMPAGYVVVVDTPSDDVSTWTPAVVQVTDLTGVLFPEDPEPEYVAINGDNLGVVTFQENNAIALIDLESLEVVSSFTAGTVDLFNIDTEEEGIIDMSSSLLDVPREPDGVTFIGDDYFATADEGDLYGGSRGFTVFNLCGDVEFSSGSTIDQICASYGHYPDERSGNKGSEPENVFFGTFEGTDYLFVNAERAGLVFVYDVSDPTSPKYKQALPTNVGPEGGIAVPSRNLIAVASEKDARDDKMRSTVTIYQYSEGSPTYPTLYSERNAEGVPIPFSAMSGLSNDPNDDDTLYCVEDSFYKSSRMFVIDISSSPAVLTAGIKLVDSSGVFASVSPYGEFSADDLSAMINEDMTVNIDPEGIAAVGDGTFWIVSEGRGTVGDADRPIESLNFLFKVNTSGEILEVVTLPDEINDIQLRFGLEGVTVTDGGMVVVAFQRAWGDNAEPYLGCYDTNTQEWTFVFYPLDAPESQYGGWVGLSDISWVGDMSFYVLERDNQGGPDASIKRIYSIDLEGVSDGDTVSKTFLRDLIPDYVATGGLVMEKVEGMAVTGSGVWIINDNDGVDDNSGETQLLNLGSF